MSMALHLNNLALRNKLAGTRDILDGRYDDIQSGKVKLVPGDEVIARLRERSAAYRLRGS